MPYVYTLDSHRRLTASMRIRRKQSSKQCSRPTSASEGLATAAQPNSDFREQSRSSLFFWLFTSTCYCKRFAQSAGPWFGHRFAQSAGPRPPLRSVRCVMEICCVSQPLCHPFALLCEFRTLFDTVFRSLGSLLEDPGNIFFHSKSK